MFIIPLTHAESSDDMGLAKFTEYANVLVGEGEDNVQVIVDTEGGLPVGPQAFDISQDGTVYLLDSGRNRVVVVNESRLESISLPFAVMPTDILLHQNKVYILDSNALVHELTIQGELLKSYSLPEGVGNLVVHQLVEKNGEVVLWLENYIEFPLNNLPKKLNVDDYITSEVRGVELPNGSKVYGEYHDFKHGHIYSSDGEIDILIATDQAFGSLFIAGYDDQSNIYVIVEELADPSPYIMTEVTLRRYNQEGKLTGVAKVPESVAYTQRFAKISPDGTVHLMVVNTDKVMVYNVDLGERYISTLANVRDALIEEWKANEETEVYATFVGNPVNRGPTRSRAYGMTYTTWEWNTQYDKYPTTGANRGTNDKKPVQLPSTNGSTVTGIPYLWGGWDTSYSKTDGSPWSNWDEALDHYTTYGPIVGDTSSAGSVLYGGKGAGVDCSGFVATAANIYSYSGTKPGTSTILSDSISVFNTTIGSGFSTYSGMQYMDIFVKSGHVLFYDYRAADGSGIYTVEATVDYGGISGDNIQGAKKYKRTWSWLSGNNYQHRTWWSKESGDDFDNAKTASGNNHLFRGQIIYHKWTNGSTAAYKTVTVTPSASGYDPNLLVYSSSYSLLGESKLGAGSTENYTFYAAANTTYYFAVYGNDTFNSYTISY